MPPTPLPPGQNPDDCSPAARYAGKLLADLGVSAEVPIPDTRCQPAKRWADCGLMYLTGTGDGDPELCPVPLPDCADGALDAFRILCGKPLLPAVRGAQLLTERSAIMGLCRHGDRSPQGHCRLLATADGHIALNLARGDDRALLPALFGREEEFHWQEVKREIRTLSTDTLLSRGRLLGLAIADATAIPQTVTPWFRAASGGQKASPPAGPTPLVVDLSSLWAGPLCTHLWQRAGARVIKVESRQRPDGARAGSRDFFHLLNDGKEFVSLDFRSERGRQQLRELILAADIVVEASRPRALRQMGIIAEELIAARPGLTWVGITGYGRGEPAANWVAYGDDAGIAAGLSAVIHRATGDWLVCGDAIADPLTGLHAALAGWAAWRAGGGTLIDISLQAVVSHCIAATAPADGDYRKRHRRWQAYLAVKRIGARPPLRRGETPSPP